MIQWIRAEQHPPEDKEVLLTNGVNWWKGSWTWTCVRFSDDPDYEQWDYRYRVPGENSFDIEPITHWADVQLPPEQIGPEDELAARYYRGEIDNLGRYY